MGLANLNRPLRGRDCQITVCFTIWVDRYPDDLAFGSDGAGGHQPGRPDTRREGLGKRIASDDEGIEIDEFPVLADKRTNDAGVRIRRNAGDFSCVVDAKPKAERVIVDTVLDGFQVLHFVIWPGPKESVSSLIAYQIRLSDHLTEIVDVVGHVVNFPSQVA